MGDNFPTCGCT